MKKEVTLKTNHHQSSGILLSPDRKQKLGVVLAHGAGGNMHSAFIRFFHEQIAANGYPCLKFNFPYSESGKKAPDPQAVLIASYRKAIEAIAMQRLVIGGKSMGGRIASYVAGEAAVAGLLFLGYPLHPPGKKDQLRDEHLYSIRKPMLFVSGTKDPFAQMDLLKATIKKIGKYATLFLVENGGHSLDVSRSSGVNQEDIYQDVLQSILDWLKKLQ